MDSYKIPKAVTDILRVTDIDFIGEGTFKRVFRAKKDDGEAVALKILKSENLTDRDRREYAVFGKCDHPGIVKLLSSGDVKTHDGQVFYVLEEYVAGGSLHDEIERQGRITGQRAKGVCIQVVGAIEHLSELSIVHRDIKPANILCRENSDDVVLTDFGLARDLGDASLTADFLPSGPGTPLFAPPEQLLNEKALIGWRSDQFSLGITLSLGCLGKHPYQKDGESLNDWWRIVGRVRSRESPNEKVLEAADAIGIGFIRKMVQPWPVERFQKFEKLRSRLDEVN